MDNKKEVWVKAGLAVVVIAAVVAMLRRHRMNDAQILASQPPATPDFYSMYYQTNPGISDSGVNGGNDTFTAQNTININTGAISGLSNAYMPMFGLVGMTAIGS